MPSLGWIHRETINDWDSRFAQRVIAFQVPDMTYWGDVTWRRWPRIPNVDRIHKQLLRDFDAVLKEL